jgi:hypothetical protein
VTGAAAHAPLETDSLDSEQPTTCDRTHRDLTISWDARRYLCVREGRRSAFLKAGGWQLPQRLTRSLLAANAYTAYPPAQQNPEAHAAVLSPLPVVEPASISPPLTVASAAAEPGVLEGPTGTEAGSIAETAAGDAPSARIWFAPVQAQLGEKGLARSLALLPDVQAARRVTLLGVFEDSELASEPGPLDRERFSVARALSVRDLWIREGVDPEKLTILHHQDRLAGRYVEVMLHD